jgi:uncharacterized protein YceK
MKKLLLTILALFFLGGCGSVKQQGNLIEPTQTEVGKTEAAGIQSGANEPSFLIRGSNVVVNLLWKRY